LLGTFLASAACKSLILSGIFLLILIAGVVYMLRD
jgi:hypothetical protein